MRIKEGLIGVNIWRKSIHSNSDLFRNKELSSGSDSYGQVGEFEYLVSRPFITYPILETEVDKDSVLIIEGLISNNKNITAALKQCCNDLLEGNVSRVDFAKSISMQLADCGTYVIYFISKEICLVIPDSFCRLPLYYSSNRMFSFIGRSIALVRSFLSPLPDMDGVLSFLWCGYPLGKTTLFEHIYRLESGFYIELGEFELKLKKIDSAIGFSEIGIETQSTYELNKENTIDTIADKFRAAIKRTCSYTDSPVHLMLSGGLDSRAVLGGLVDQKIVATASSYDESGSNKDAVVAEILAKYFLVGWKKFDLLEHKLSSEKKELLDIKQGLNYLGMAFILPYLKCLNGQTVLTGDGGDKAFPYLGDHRAYQSYNELVQVLIQRHAIFPPQMLCQLLDRHIDDLYQIVYDEVALNKENEIHHASIRFVLKQRAFKAYFEGEDRNRFYCWSLSPFYDADFFQFMMSFPKKMKQHGKLYPDFLKKLNEKLVQVPLPSGYKPGSITYHLQHYAVERIRTNFKLKELIKNTILNWSKGGSQELAHINISSNANFLKPFSRIKGNTLSTEARLHLETLDRVFP